MLRTSWDGVLLELKARPGSGRFALRAGKDGLVAALRSPPEGGKANRELAKELGRVFDCTAELVSGEKARKKVVLLRGALLAEAEERLRKALTDRAT